MRAKLEAITEDFNQSFHCDQYQAKEFSAPWHYHPYWELTFIEEGHGVAFLGNSIRQFCAGEVVLVAPNIPHNWRNTPNENGVPVRSIFCQWQSEALSDTWIDLPEFSSVNVMLKRCNTGLLFDLGAKDQNTDEKISIVESIIQLPTLKGFEKLWLFIDILHRLSLLPAKSLNADISGAIDPKIAGRVAKVFSFVENNFNRNIKAEEVAELTHLTTTSFSKFFSKTFNKPFTKFLAEYRINQACNLLISSNATIEEVAFQCGYNNLALFHRQFKQVCHLTPNQYRNSF